MKPRADVEPTRTGPGSLYTTLELIRLYLGIYGAFTFFISVLTGTLGLAASLLVIGESGAWGFLAIWLALAAYGLVCALAMFRCWIALRRSEPEAPRWTRWTLTASIPGSLLTGGLGIGVLAMSSDGITTASANFFHWVGVSIGGALFLGAIANIVILLRVLIWQDLEELLWEDLQSNIEDGMGLQVEDDLDDGVFLDDTSETGTTEPAVAEDLQKVVQTRD